MAIRIRRVKGLYVALCAAESQPDPGDIYLNDGMHSSLTEKFTKDFESEGLIAKPMSDEEAESLTDKLIDASRANSIKVGYLKKLIIAALTGKPSS
jgi:hypothetical protein